MRSKVFWRAARMNPGIQSIQNSNVVAFPQESVYHVGSDEPSPTGY
jgi:tRNA A37 threonylcarbamoyladenosine synthetase subunit TsaC/SUA5/YrdC